MAKKMLAFVAFVLVAAVVAATTPAPVTGQGTEDGVNPETAVEDEMPLVDVPANPVAPDLVDFDVPEGLFRSESELRADRFALIDLKVWNERRGNWGFDALPESIMNEKALDEYLEHEAEYDLPVSSGELSRWIEIRDHSRRLLDFHDQVARQESYLTAVIDEAAGELTVWVSSRSDSLATPSGAQVIETGFSRRDIDAFMEDAEWLNQATRPIGYEVSSTVEDERGLILEMAPTSGNEIDNSVVPLIEKVVNDRVGRRPDTPFSIEIILVEPSDTSEQFCNGTTRCDTPIGGVRWDSCTSGYMMRDPGSDRRGISTAGHCTGSHTAFPVRGTDLGATGQSDSMSVFVSTSSPDLIVNNANMDLRISRALTSESGALTATYFRNSTYGNRAIVSTMVIPNGTNVCVSPRSSTNRLCGDVEDNDFDNGTATQNGIRVAWFGTATQGGDSGSPVTLESNSTVAISAHEGVLTSGANVGDGISYRTDFFPAYLAGRYVGTTGSAIEGKTDSFSARLYRQALQRTSPVSGMDYWSAQVQNSGTCTATSQWVINFFLTDAGEVQSALPLTSQTNKRRRIHRLYWAAFNRAADIGGRDYWVSQLNSETDWNNIVNYFVYGVGETTNAVNGLVGHQQGPC